MKHVVPCQITVTKNLSFHGGSDHSWKEGMRTTWQWELHIKWGGTVAFWHALHIISPGDTSSFEDVSVKESLDLNLQQHRAVQTLLKYFSNLSTPVSKVLSLWGAHSLPAGQDIMSFTEPEDSLPCS